MVGCLVPDYIWLRLMRRELPMKRWQVIPFALICHLYSLICAKLFSVIEFGTLGMVGGMRLYGGLFFMPVIIYLFAKLAGWRMADAFDIVGISTIYSSFMFRLNCFWHGCCTGTEIPGTAGWHWPIREVELLLYIVLLIVYIPRVKKGQTKGVVYPVLLVAYGAVRFLLEWFREEYVTAFGVLHWAHVWSLLSVGIGLSVYFTVVEKHKRKAVKRGGK